MGKLISKDSFYKDFNIFSNKNKKIPARNDMKKLGYNETFFSKEFSTYTQAKLEALNKFPSIKKFEEINTTKEQIVDAFIDYCRKNKKYPNLIDLNVTKDKVKYYFAGISGLTEYCRKKEPEVFKELQFEFANRKSNYVLRDYATVCKKLGKYATKEEAGLSTRTVEKFGSFRFFVQKSKEQYPEYFKDVIDYNIWTSERLQKIKKVVKGNRRFFITTAVGNSSVNDKFYENIKYYCKINNAELLILVADNDLTNLDTKICNEENIVFNDVEITKNLYISTIKIHPKMIKPTTGLRRLCKKNGSMIFGSPKQFLSYTPNMNHNIPRAIMTTGAITEPNYFGEMYIQKRTDYLAHNDHVMGGIIVEVESDEHFHFRQVQMNKDGGFIDLGILYEDGKKTPIRASCIIYGDLHSQETDWDAIRAFEKLQKIVKADKCVLHDSFSGISVNHHDDDNIIRKAQKALDGRLCLRDELDNFVRDLNYFGDLYNEVLIAKGNHDLFLEKYLQEAKYAKEPHNHLIGLQLATEFVQKRDPLRWYAEQRLKKPNKFKWLTENDETKIEGFLVSLHGHKGGNGKRNPPIESLEIVWEKIILAHLHTPEIVRKAVRVGTCSRLSLDYNEGASSWMHTSCVLYPGGSFQLINIVNGKFQIGG
jgi:hypothetical protein